MVWSYELKRIFLDGTKFAGIVTTAKIATETIRTPRQRIYYISKKTLRSLRLCGDLEIAVVVLDRIRIKDVFHALQI